MSVHQYRRRCALLANLERAPGGGGGGGGGGGAGGSGGDEIGGGVGGAATADACTQSSRYSLDDLPAELDADVGPVFMLTFRKPVLVLDTTEFGGFDETPDAAAAAMEEALGQWI